MSIPIETEEKKPRMKREEVSMKKSANANNGEHNIQFTVIASTMNVEQQGENMIVATFQALSTPLPVLDLAKEVPDWRNKASGRDEIESYSLEMKGGAKTLFFEYKAREWKGKTYPEGKISVGYGHLMKKKIWGDFDSKELAIRLNKEKDDYAYCAMNDYQCRISSNVSLSTMLTADTRLLGFKYDPDDYKQKASEVAADATDYERYSKMKMESALVDNGRKVMGTSSDFKVGVELSCDYVGPVGGMNRYDMTLLIVASGYDDKDISRKKTMLDTMKDIVTNLKTIGIHVKENNVADANTVNVQDVVEVEAAPQRTLEDVNNLTGDDLLAYMDGQ